MILKIRLWQEEDLWCASVPAFPGCHSYGETEAEALSMIKEAALGWLEVANERVVDKGLNSKMLELAL
jgi:predicted RNase H-like HicB family nuclease